MHVFPDLLDVHFAPGRLVARLSNEDIDHKSFPGTEANAVAKCAS